MIVRFRIPAPARALALTFLAITALVAASAHASSPIELVGPDGAKVFVDGGSIGHLPLTEQLALRPGTYEIRCELPGHQPYEQTVRILQGDGTRVIRVRLIPYSQRAAWASNLLLAGLGQHYLNRKVKGWIFNVAEIGGLLTALVAEAERSNFRQDYILLKDKYDSEINAEVVAHLRSEAANAYSDMEDMENLRNTGLIVAGAAVALSILDAVLYFPHVQAGAGTTPVAIGALPDRDATYDMPLDAVHVGWKTTF